MVHRGQHFRTRHSNLSCAGAPISDPPRSIGCGSRYLIDESPYHRAVPLLVMGITKVSAPGVVSTFGPMSLGGFNRHHGKPGNRFPVMSFRTFDLGFKTWVRPYLVGPRTGNEDNDEVDQILAKQRPFF